MKTLHKIIIILLFLVSYTGFSKTPEQQKLIEKAEHMRDSILNTPEMKAIMKQADEMEKKTDIK